MVSIDVMIDVLFMDDNWLVSKDKRQRDNSIKEKKEYYVSLHAFNSSLSSEDQKSCSYELYTMIIMTGYLY